MHSGPEQPAISHSPDDDLVTALVRFDEELRGGNPVSTGDGLHDATAEGDLAAAQACLSLLERAYPRAATPSAAPRTSMGRFELIRVLGQGGFGIVYLAYDPKLNRHVALKVPRLHTLAHEPLQQRFLREARAGAALDHPNLVPVLETGTQGAVEYIVTPYYEGPNLAEWLRDNGSPAPRLAARLVAVLAGAMDTSHRSGVLHRDLKPTNILLTSSVRDTQKCPGHQSPIVTGDELPFVPRITDFGLAKLKEETANETGSAVLGTLLYMAPEQTLSQTDRIGPATDVYSLGVILYELLTGRPPIDAHTLLEMLNELRAGVRVPPSRLRSGVPRDLDTICLKCLEVEPSLRYPTAAALASDLQAFLDGRPIAARPPSSTERTIKWVRRHPWAAGMLSILMVLSLSLLTGLFVHLRSLQEFQASTSKQNAELKRSAGDLSAALLDSQRLQRLATANERRAQDLLHAAEMQLAAKAWKEKDSGELNRVLAESAKRLPPGTQPDFAWNYLHRQNSGMANADTSHGRLIDRDVQQLWHASFSPDNRWLATCGSKGWIRVYDVQQNFQLAQQINTDQIEVNSVSFNSDSTLLASAGDDGRVCLWNWPDGTLRRPVMAYSAAKAFGVKFLINSRQFVTCGTTNEVMVWDAETGESIHTWKASGGVVDAIAVRNLDKDRQEQCVSMASDSGQFHFGFLDGERGPKLETSTLEPDTAKCVAFSANGRWHVAGYHNGLVRLDQFPKGIRRRFSRPDGIVAVAVTSDGTVICTDRGGSIVVESPASKSRAPNVQRVWNGGAPQLPGLAIARDGKTFITAGTNGEVRQWLINAPQGNPGHTVIPPTELEVQDHFCFLERPLRVLRSGYRGLSAQSLSPDAEAELRRDLLDVAACDCREGVIAAGTLHGEVFWLNGFSGPISRRIQLFSKDKVVDDVVLYPGADRAVVLGGGLHSSQGTLALVDLNDGRMLARSESDHIISVALAPDSSVLAACERNTNALLLLDPATLKVRQRCLGHRGTLDEAAFSPDSRMVVTVSDDRTGIAWDVATGERRWTLSGHRGELSGVAISPDGRTIATVGVDGVIKLWSAESGTELFELAHLNVDSGWIGFTPDGSQLIANLKGNALAVFDGSPIEHSEPTEAD